MCERELAQSDLFPSFFSCWLLIALGRVGSGYFFVVAVYSKLMDFLAVFRFFNVSSARFSFCVEIVLSLWFVHAQFVLLISG